MPRVWRGPLLILSGGLLLMTLPALAQTQTPTDRSGAPVPAPAQPPAFSSPSAPNVQAVGPNFKLQPGDVLAVQVANHPEMSSSSVAVAANGQLNLPTVGALSAQGKTLGQVTSNITRAYSTQLKRPQVSVTLISSVPRQMVVRGAVAKPGPVDVRNDLRLSEIVAAVGGLMVDGTPLKGNEVKASLVRGKAGERPLDVAMALSAPQSAANLTLKAGDIINISPLPLVSVALAGDAVTPSMVKIRLSSDKPQVRVSDVLGQGNDLKLNSDQVHGYLLRQGQKTDLNLNALFKGGDTNADLVLQSGDKLTFEANVIKKIDVTVVSLDGSVKVPGNYSFENDASALRAIVQAGGFATDVSASQIAVTVQRGGRTIPVDVEHAILDPHYDVPLESKDTVYTAYIPTPRVRVLGSVTKPDVYRLKENATVLDAITMGGGLLMPSAQATIRVVRTTKEGKQISIDVDAVRLFGMTDLSQNVRLVDGDLVFVGESRRGRQVYIAGEVTTPGAIELGESDGMAELLLKAGGAKSSAALSKLNITKRGGTQHFVDASPILHGQKVDVALEEGDYVNVPRSDMTVTVLGAVAKPDKYTIPENGTLTLADVLIAAGGTTANAKLKDVAVVHSTAEGTSKPEVIPVDNVTSGITTVNYQLRKGDVVWVPQGKVTPSGLSKLSQTLGILTLAARF